MQGRTQSQVPKMFLLRQIQLLSVSNIEENSIKIVRVIRENGADQTWK